MIVEFVYIWTALELWPLRLHCGCWCLRIRQFISLHPESIGWRPDPRPEHLHHHRRHRPSHSSLLSLLLCQVILFSALIMSSLHSRSSHFIWHCEQVASPCVWSTFRYCGSKKEEDAEIGLVKNGEVTVEFILSKDMKSNPFFLTIN